MGIPSNATMLYGHQETFRERAEHLARLREAQDEAPGFMAFIPLAFHPSNTDLGDLPGPTAVDDLMNIILKNYGEGMGGENENKALLSSLTGG